MHQKPRWAQGFTIVEVLVAIAVVISLFALAVVLIYSRTTITISGAFSTAPPTIPAGQGSTFTYTVTRTAAGRTMPLSRRVISFRVAPNGTVITVSPAQGTTDGSGNISVIVTPHQDYRAGGNIWAKDVASGQEDSPVHFTVTD